MNVKGRTGAHERDDVEGRAGAHERDDVEGLVDGDARRAIREQLEQTFVVEAAAGTGKTTELVQRIVAVVERGLGRLSSIVAVTFTEKAAGEMKLRIRTELDRALLSRGQESAVRARLEAALRELETAKMGTIHALCAELLREHPVEARVDPAFEVADAFEERALLERAFDDWFERTLAAPGEGVRRVLARRAFDERGQGAREQLLFAAGRLVETRDFDAPYRRDPLEREGAIQGVIAELAELAALAERASATHDPLRVALAALGQQLARVRHADLDLQEAFLRKLVRDRKVWSERRGRGQHYGPGLTRQEVIERRAHARAGLEAAVRALDADLAACLFRELAPVVRAYEAEKAAHGRLDFFDLLLLARDLLRDDEAVRHAVQRDISHLFVDEFQDTDPVQSELLLLISADDANERDPWRVRPVPGKLFVVGDPKQSIYRFRRADVALYERIKQQLVRAGASVLELSTSFRSLPAIQALVNAAFEPLMAGQVERGQPQYVRLSPFRAARASQPAIVALPAPAPYSDWGRVTKKQINACLPDAVAAWLDWLLRKSRYLVHEGGRDVPLAARHVCLLFRRFRALGEDITRDYVRALEARGIPHLLSGGRSFHAREEVIALRAALTAIEWPDDALHVYATLRGPFVALHDEALYAFKRRVGHLSPLAPVELDTLSDDEREVAGVLALLAELHRQRNRRPIAETVARFLRELRAHAGIAIWPSGEQALGNVLRVLDYARGYERRGRASSFRGFVEWLAQHAELGEAADAPVIEESSDGVRIMTVHAAKGLEFPVVVLCDPGAPIRPERPSRYIDPARRLWAQTLCDAAPIELQEQHEQVRDHDEAESVRLAYVAVTRAKELLVVPAVGEGKLEGWIDLLRPAIYPSPEQRRSPQPASGCPPFGGDSLVRRPIDLPQGPEASVAPGAHRPSAGEHAVVWWDPHLLDLGRRALGGVTQQDLLRADEQGASSEQGLAAYGSFREARALARARGRQPSLSTRTITELAKERGAEVDARGCARERNAVDARGCTRERNAVDARERSADLSAPQRVHVEVIESGLQRAGRPSGPRFGALVHALFEHALAGEGEDPSASLAPMRELARFVGRSLGADAGEVEHAANTVARAREHPFFARVRRARARGELFREAPVTVCMAPHELREGTVDLAFREASAAGAKLVLVDFKTDLVLTDLTVYSRQLALYADALRRALAEPVECVLFHA